jgi:predicted  nucleic acid-binding Zn-ribbon protein
MKGGTDVRGLRDIRTMRTVSRRSMPRKSGSAYLDLYMLRLEQERLQREAAQLDKRSQGIQERTQAIQKRLGEIQKLIERLERLTRSEGPNNGVKKAAEPSGPAKRKWKTFPLKY